MKFLIFFALAFATATATNLNSRLIEDPVLENEGRIVNGQKANASQFKYQVCLALAYHSRSNLGWCGGSLIGDKWVLSAGHCGSGVARARVYLGATKRERPEKYYDVPEKDIFVHPLYNAGLKVNDISLIKIPETNESSRIAYVKIPNNAIDQYLNEIVVVSGWGVTSENGTEPADDLQYAILKVSPGKICFERYGVLFSAESRICVATPDRVSTCHGDSGGPLVLEGENLQIGVSSFGGDGCVRKEPLVFTRVSAYHVWIFARSGIRS